MRIQSSIEGLRRGTCISRFPEWALFVFLGKLLQSSTDGLVTGIVYTQIAAALALGCLAAVSGPSTAAVIFMGYTAFQWMDEPGMSSLLMNQVTPSEQTGASAMNFLVINVAQAIAAAVAGASFVRFGYPVVLSVTATVGLVAALLSRLLLGKDPLPVSRPAPAEVGA